MTHYDMLKCVYAGISPPKPVVEEVYIETPPTQNKELELIERMIRDQNNAIRDREVAERVRAKNQEEEQKRMLDKLVLTTITAGVMHKGGLI